MSWTLRYVCQHHNRSVLQFSFTFTYTFSSSPNMAFKKNSAGVSWARTFTSLVYLIHASTVYCSSGCLLVYFSLYVLYELLVCVSVFCVLFLSFNITFDYHSNLINFSWLLLENIVVFFILFNTSWSLQACGFLPPMQHARFALDKIEFYFFKLSE